MVQVKATVDFGRLGQDFAAFVADPTTESSVAYAERMGLKISHTHDIRGKRYHIVRYDKSRYGSDNTMKDDAVTDAKPKLAMTDEVGMLRSIIISDGKIRCISLPKATRKMEDVPSNDAKSVLLEGPMVNVFYYKDDESQGDDIDGKGWQITTRSVFGARNSYFDNDDGTKLTFRTMFLEAMSSSMFSNLDRNTVYSYVVRHPKNRDVYGVARPYLVLVASFKPRDDSNLVWDYTGPDVAEDLSTKNTNVMGMTAAWADSNGNLVRAKSLNDNYLTLRKLRGTQPKLKFHYLTLRKQRGAVAQYLTNFPEHTTVFNVYREEIHEFTKQLQANYWESYVRRAKPLNAYDGRFKQHMFNLHAAFKGTGKPQLLSQVIQYVNNLQPAQLMFSLNWDNHSKVAKTKTVATAANDDSTMSE